MERNDLDRRALIAGVGAVAAAGLIATRAKAASPRQAEYQAILDKIARTDQGFGECCLPVQAFPDSNAAFKLTDPGSYYLNGNVVVPAGQNGIEIAGSHIDLDLNGYSVIGETDAAGLPGGTGILCAGSNIAIYDGSIVGFDVGIDFEGATYSMTWDVTAIDGGQAAFRCGGFNQHYDNEAHRYRSGVGYWSRHGNTLLQECGAFSCAVGFRVAGSKNLVLSNSATDCPTPFDLRSGNAWGPVVVATGDLSTVANASDVNSNMVY